ncbi:MAG: hypothetical protein LBV71_01295 [Prevotella sp.]|jgi:hypothetical protein|nr:hypothetical protein [Prevotella sp.]
MKLQKRIKNHKYNIICIILFLFLSYSQQSYSQYKFRYDNDYLTTLTFGLEKNNGFRVSISLVALFTTGASDRNGFRVGAGITLSQTIDNWTLLTGMDAYKAYQKFGLGTSFAGVEFDDGKYGGSYYVNKYYQGDKQVSGIVSLHLNDFRINFEDDILAYPFTGFKVYDRYRTAALEVRFKGFMIGTNVYTTDINGVTDASLNNSKGVYCDGKQISSPVYVGYATNGMILRYGINNRVGGVAGQNGWHRSLFNTPDFRSGDYKNQFLQIGVDKPYTLY